MFSKDCAYLLVTPGPDPSRVEWLICNLQKPPVCRGLLE